MLPRIPVPVEKRNRMSTLTPGFWMMNVEPPTSDIGWLVSGHQTGMALILNK